MRSRSSASARSQQRARGTARSGDRLRAPGIGPGVRDGGVARDARRRAGGLRARQHRVEALARCPCARSPSRSSSRSTFSPTTEKRKCPGSMMPACTGPDRDLVHAVALDAHERIVVGPGCRSAARRSRGAAESSRRARLRGAARAAVVGFARAMPTRSHAARCMRFAAGKSSARLGIGRRRRPAARSSSSSRPVGIGERTQRARRAAVRGRRDPTARPGARRSRAMSRAA